MPRKPNNAFHCYTCGPNVGHKRSALHSRKFKLYCAEHLPDKSEPWPHCPECNDDDFGTFDWKGSSEATTIKCENCGFKDKAINHFDAVTIRITASPIEVSG